MKVTGKLLISGAKFRNFAKEGLEKFSPWEGFQIELCRLDGALGMVQGVFEVRAVGAAGGDGGDGLRAVRHLAQLGLGLQDAHRRHQGGNSIDSGLILGLVFGPLLGPIFGPLFRTPFNREFCSIVRSDFGSSYIITLSNVISGQLSGQY